jgi:DNA-binding NarL/FixJ family response regulator
MHIFQFLGAGLASKQIADSLELSVKTVESLRENIKHKLNLRSGAELRQRAIKWLHFFRAYGTFRATPLLNLLRSVPA